MNVVIMHSMVWYFDKKIYKFKKCQKKEGIGYPILEPILTGFGIVSKNLGTDPIVFEISSKISGLVTCSTKLDPVPGPA